MPSIKIGFKFLILGILLLPLVAKGQGQIFKFIVAQDGSGDFKYIQDAINAVRVYLPKSITIKIKKGK